MSSPRTSYPEWEYYLEHRTRWMQEHPKAWVAVKCVTSGDRRSYEVEFGASDAEAVLKLDKRCGRAGGAVFEVGALGRTVDLRRIVAR
ncbi:MAG: hypothetical protein JNM07_10275 [Phycisphaerae bacterium]|nr:hypothetical protein [Phycisphaerae bacterium]